MAETRADNSFPTVFRSKNGEFADAEGKLHTSHKTAKRLYPDRNLSVPVEAAEDGVTLPYSSGAEGIQEYALCVIKGSNPFIGFIDVDWKLLRTWVAQQNWGALTRHPDKEVPKRVAKIGIKEVVKLNPQGIAVTLTMSATAYVFWQQWQFLAPDSGSRS